MKLQPCLHSDRSFEKQFEKRVTKPFKDQNKKRTGTNCSPHTPDQRSLNGVRPVTSAMSTPRRNRNTRHVGRSFATNESPQEYVDSNKKIKPDEELLRSFGATNLNQYAVFLMEWFTDDPTKKERKKNLSSRNLTKQPRPDENFDISALADIIRNCNIFLADLKLQCCWNTL